MYSLSPQWNYNGTQLTLFVTPAPLFVRIALYLFALLPLLVVFSVMVWSIADRSFKPGIIIGLAAAVFIGSRVLRMALWNSVGKECISISGNTVVYQPDYKLMKGDKKELMFEVLTFGLVIDHSTEQGSARLRIGSGENELVCVTNMRVEELENLLMELERNYAVDWGTTEEGLI